MKSSESVGEIGKALAKIQSKLPAVGKDSTGYGYEYASLPEVCNKVYPLAADAGLSISQVLDESSAAGPAITTVLFHSSGEWLSGTYPLAEAGMKGVNSAQQFGAAITYARRYGLLAVLGVPVADDDAACLSAPSATPKKRSKPRTGNEKPGKDKVLALIGASPNYKKMSEIYLDHSAQAEAEGWNQELVDLCSATKEKKGWA